MKHWGLVFFLVITIFTEVLYAARDKDLGELPHGNVYLINPEVESATTNVVLRVDNSGFLKNRYIHVLVDDWQGADTYQEINPFKATVVQATVFYHTDIMVRFLMNSGFTSLPSPLKIILSSQIEEPPIVLFPTLNTIFFGGSGLNKHALDADILRAAVTSMFVMNGMDIDEITEQLFTQVSIVDGISYFLACYASNNPVFASSVKNIDIDEGIEGYFPSERDEIAVNVARALWDLAKDMGKRETAALIIDAIHRYGTIFTVEDLLEALIFSDIAMFQGKDSDLIYSAFGQKFGL